MASTDMRNRWSALVDAVAQMDSTEELPRAYVHTQYLPGERDVPADLLEALRAEDGDYEQKADALFREQISFEEGCRAKPMLLKFSSHATAGESSGEGPDFYQISKAATATTGGRLSDGSRVFGTSSRLSSGFVDMQHFSSLHRQPHFMPIILVPSSVSAPLQLHNIRSFLEHGDYVDPTTLFVDEETGASNVQDTKPESVIVSPGSFLDTDKYRVAFTQFRVVDHPSQVADWSHVCACLVEGKRWQFNGWYPEEPASSCEPSHLFTRVRGFLPYFEEDKVPPATQQWRVQPLVLTRRVVKTQQHILEAAKFWEQLYTYLDQHPYFKLYSVRQDA